MIPAPGRVLLRPIETEESMGRIALLDSTRENMTPNQYEVVSVGFPAICDDADCERRHVTVCSWWNAHPESPNPRHVAHPSTATTGDWVLVRHRAVAPTEDDHLVIAWQDDIMAILSLPTGPQ